MIRKLAAAAVAAVVGFTATQSLAAEYGSAAATDTRPEVKISPGGRSTVYTHIPAARRGGDRPYALTGDRPEPVVRHNIIRVGSRVVAVIPVTVER